MTLTETFGWVPGELLPGRPASEHVRQAELLLARPLSTEAIVERGMAACASVLQPLLIQGLPSWAAAAAANSSRTTLEFLRRGGDELMAVVVCCWVPLTPSILLTEFLQSGEGSVRGLLILGELPKEAQIIRSFAEETKVSFFSRALAEQSEYLRSLGENEPPCAPMEIVQETAGNVHWASDLISGEVHVRALNGGPCAPVARYRKADLHMFMEQYNGDRCSGFLI